MGYIIQRKLPNKERWENVTESITTFSDACERLKGLEKGGHAASPLDLFMNIISINVVREKPRYRIVTQEEATAR